MRLCGIEGCGRKHNSRGYCAAHYMRWSRHGDPSASEPIGPPRSNPMLASYAQVVASFDVTQNRRLSSVPWSGDVRTFAAALDAEANRGLGE